MIGPEPERLEEGLRRISPAPVPEALMEQLRTAASQPKPVASARPTFRWSNWLASWRGLALAGSAAAIIAIARIAQYSDSPDAVNLSDSGIKANAVQVDHSLLASFDQVAQLPGGEPVRLRYREWQDEVVIHDAAHGMVISQIIPRVEVIPVRFETY